MLFIESGTWGRADIRIDFHEFLHPVDNNFISHISLYIRSNKIQPDAPIPRCMTSITFCCKGIYKYDNKR